MSDGNPKPLEGRIAVITGAARGIGREYALMFASLGAKLVSLSFKS